MRRQHQLIPAFFDLLESRVVPSHGGPGAAVGGGPALHAQHRSLAPHDPSLTDEINQVFDSFRNDYDQARATYFTSIQNQPAPSVATTYAFVAYTTQRVSLLAQQTLGVVYRARLGAGEAQSLKHLVTKKIIGPKLQMPPGSLAQSLLATTPQPATTAPTSSLYSLGEDAAIESARVAILNGVGGP